MTEPEPAPEAPEEREAPLPLGQLPAGEPEAERKPESRITGERPQALPQPPSQPTPPPVVEEPRQPPPAPLPLQPPALDEVPFSEDAPPAAAEPEPQPAPQMPAPRAEPPRQPTPEPEPPAGVAAEAEPPRFAVRSGADGSCGECRGDEVAVSVERSVPAGGGDCPSDAAGVAMQLAGRLASRGEGLGQGMPLDGPEVVRFTSGEASCQLFGVVLPPGVRYRGYTYAVADGAGGGGPCFFGKQCPVRGALWPDRPVIEELPNGARVVFGLFRNGSGVPLRASLTVFYVAGK